MIRYHGVKILGLLLLLATDRLALAQTAIAHDKASRRTLEIEWIRSPRAVLELNAAPTRAGSADSKSRPDASTIEPAAGALPADPQVWSLEIKDKRLSWALTRWAQQAGWQLIWEAARDFEIESSLHLSGDFLQSVSTVMRSLANTDYPLQAKANPSTLTLRISRYQDANAR